MDTQKGYSPPGTPWSAASILPGRRSSSPIFVRPTISTTLTESFSKFATTSFFPSAVTARPAAVEGKLPNPIPPEWPSVTVERVGHLQDLFLHRGAAGDVVDENVLVGLSGICVPRRVILTVVAAGQDQECLAVGAGSGCYRLTGGKIRMSRQIGIQRLKGRARCGCRSNLLASRKEFSAGAGLARETAQRQQCRERQGDKTRFCGYDALRSHGGIS